MLENCLDIVFVCMYVNRYTGICFVLFSVRSFSPHACYTEINVVHTVCIPYSLHCIHQLLLLVFFKHFFFSLLCGKCGKSIASGTDKIILIINICSFCSSAHSLAHQFASFSSSSYGISFAHSGCDRQISTLIEYMSFVLKRV